MVITTLDPVTALVVIDLQKGIASIARAFSKLGESGTTADILAKLGA